MPHCFPESKKLRLLALELLIESFSYRISLCFPLQNPSHTDEPFYPISQTKEALNLQGFPKKFHTGHGVSLTHKTLHMLHSK